MNGNILYTAESIRTRIKELSRQISKDYAGKDLVVVGVLKGAAIFLADLIREIETPLKIDFVQLSSYGPDTESSGQIRMKKEPDTDISGKHVLIVEDIVDTGISMVYLLGELQKKGPADIRICSLLDKRERRKVDVVVAYTGFTIPDKFVVGYGLDHDEKYRNLPYIAELGRA